MYTSVAVGRKMRFVGLIATQEVHTAITQPDGPAKRHEHNQPARLGLEGVGLDAGLIGIDQAATGKVIFGGQSPTVEFEPMQFETAVLEQGRHDLAMKGGKPRRSEAARLAQCAPTPLVQIDQPIHGRGQFVPAIDCMQHRPAGIQQAALAAVNLLAVALGQGG